MEINGRYFLDDVETGLYEVDKQHYEETKKRIEEFKNMFIDKTGQNKVRRGTIIITSTIADDNKDTQNNEFYNLWKDKK